jgi:hypothetical protein
MDSHYSAIQSFSAKGNIGLSGALGTTGISSVSNSYNAAMLLNSQQ